MATTMSKHLPLSAELLHGRSVSCEARREGDEFTCPCGVRWAVDDADPPDCRRKRHVAPATPATVAARKEFVAPDEPIKRRKMPTPEELTSAQVRDMCAAYNACAMGSTGMRAAYRVLLDSLQ